MRKLEEELDKKLAYLLYQLTKVKHDAFNCACQKKIKKTIKHIKGLFAYKNEKIS